MSYFAFLGILAIMPMRQLLQFFVILCDTIKGNELHVKDFQFLDLTPLSGNLKMLHFDASDYLVTELCAIYINAEKNPMYNKRISTFSFPNFSKTIYATSDSFLDHMSHYASI